MSGKHNGRSGIGGEESADFRKSTGMDSNIGSLVEDAIGKAVGERGKVNVLIAGRTGVGKSTLVNEVFCGRLAETGQGRPVTRNTREYTKHGLPLSVWDTRGLEMADFEQSLAELEELVEDRSNETDPARHIHVAWLCIHEDGRRVEDAEIELHRALARHMPVIAVVTKARSDQGFKAKVRELLPEAVGVVRVRALPEELEDGHILPAMGLEDLVDATAEVIPDAMSRAFAAAQRVSSRYRRMTAHGIVVTAAVAAAAAGATPIPFSDAVLLVPIQIGMLAGISSVFNIDLSMAFLGTLVAAAAGSTGATLAGRMVVSGLLKMIPGVGTILGGIISGATAATLTTALGELYVVTLSALSEEYDGQILDGDVVVEEFKRRMDGADSDE